MDLSETHRAPHLELTPDLYLAAHQLRANLQNRILSSPDTGPKFVRAAHSFRPVLVRPLTLPAAVAL
jgi:hypothetical protein